MARTTKTAADTPENGGNIDIQQTHKPSQNTELDTAHAVNNQEPRYNITDISNAAVARFKVKPEIAAAALKMVGKQELTLTEAQCIIEEFVKREVN